MDGALGLLFCLLFWWGVRSAGVWLVAYVSCFQCIGPVHFWGTQSRLATIVFQCDWILKYNTSALHSIILSGFYASVILIYLEDHPSDRK